MLDFKGWTKIGEDKKTTTLKHDKGHTMTLAHTKLPKIQQEALKRLKFAEGGDVQSDKPQSPVTVNVGAQSPAMSQPVQSAQPVPIQVPEIPKNPNVLLPNGSMSAPGVAQTGQQALDLQSEIEKSKAQAAVPQQQQYLNQTGQLNQDFTNNINNLSQHAKDLDDYQKQHPLNENAYMENKGAVGKVATGLGLILGGAGSGLTGGPNLAYDFLNKQIDRNIDAQKTRFNQANTVWGAYKDLYGNEQVANNMARVHALDMLSHQADLTAAQLGTPQAAANNLKFKAQLAAERNKQILEASGNLSHTQNNPSGGGRNNPEPSATPSPSPTQNSSEDTSYLPVPGNGISDMVSQTASDLYGIKPSNAGNSANSSKRSVDKPTVYPILSKDAEYKLNGMQYGSPSERADYSTTLPQYTAAIQLAKFINGPKGDGVNGIHDIFQKLYQSSGGDKSSLSGLAGAAQRMAHVDILGNRIKVPAMTEAQKYYELQQNRLKTDLASSLHGLISVNDIDDMVSKYAPGYGDSPQLVKEKEADFVNSLKNALTSSQVGRYKMLAK